MTRVRNADEFLQKFRGRPQGYEKVLVPLIARVRDQYIDMTGPNRRPPLMAILKYIYVSTSSILYLKA